MAFSLPSLPYEYKALEPHIDARTMEIHHSKHHAGYVAKLNAAVEGTDLVNSSIESVLKNMSSIPSDIRAAVRNNGGGHANHSLFWQILSPDAGQAPSGQLSDAINTTFGSFDTFKDLFVKEATTRFGSGWAWLVVQDSALIVRSTANQDSPYMDGETPILGLDVWEHAYYLHYQNKRPDYINAFFNIINWQKVGELYTRAL